MKTEKEKQVPYLLVLLVCGVLLNLLGSWLMGLLSLPLYLDCVGTILAAAMGGYIPGIVVGYISNIINGVSDPTNMYYAFTSVLIAFCAAYFARRGWFKRVSGCIGAVLVFSLIGGGIGSVISWLLFGFDIIGVASTPFAQALVDRGILPPLWAHFLSDMAVDIVDKLLHVEVHIVLRQHLQAFLTGSGISDDIELLNLSVFDRAVFPADRTSDHIGFSSFSAHFDHGTISVWQLHFTTSFPTWN